MESRNPFERRKLLLFILLTFYSTDGSCLGNQPSQVISKSGSLVHHFSLQDALSNAKAKSSKAIGISNVSTHFKSKSNNLNISQKFRAGIKSTFLPSGYPDKTPERYLSYSIWSWVQDLSTQLRGVLATQRVLEGIGVGREGASALSASLNFIVRDGCGMASTLLFTAASSSRFRHDVKKWRLFADIINDVGITLEVAATLVSQHLFLPMICAGNMCKAICGVAAGACGGAINLYWATGSDISDINAKFGAQHTITGSLGLVFAALFARSVSTTSPLVLWTLYFTLTAIHIIANIKCMRLIAFNYFNKSRMDLVVNKFLSELETVKIPEKMAIDTPQIVSKSEMLFFFNRSLFKQSIPIRMGASFNTFAEMTGNNPQQLDKQLLELLMNGYVISIGKYRHGNSCIVAALGDDCKPETKAKAYFHGLLLQRMMLKDGLLGKTKLLRTPEKQKERELLVEDDVSNRIQKSWKLFSSFAQNSGWDLSKTELLTEGFEVSVST